MTCFRPFVYCDGDSEYYTGFIILNLCVVYEIEIFAILLKDREHPSCSSIFCQETENQSLLLTILEILTIVSLVVITCSDPSGSGAGLSGCNSALILEGILIIFGLIGLLAQGLSFTELI